MNKTDADTLRKNNHWVPASYLAAFTDSGRKSGLLHVYRRDGTGKPLLLPPHAVAKENYLYVIRADGEAPDDGLERMFGDHIEGPFARLRNRLVYGRKFGLSAKITSSERDELALYLAFQQLRTPHFRDTHNWMASFYGTMMARGHLEDPERVSADYQRATGKSLSASEVREMAKALDEGRITVEPNQNFWLASFLKGAMDLAETIRDLPWQLFEAPRDFEFITCDNPVVITRRDVTGGYQLGGGWLEPNVEVTFPLSPHHLMVIGRTLQSFEDVGSKEWCNQVNRRAVEHSYQAVFARSADDQIPDLLRATKGPEYTVDFAGVSYPMEGAAGPIIKEMADSPVQEPLIRFGPKR